MLENLGRPLQLRQEHRRNSKVHASPFPALVLQQQSAGAVPLERRLAERVRHHKHDRDHTKRGLLEARNHSHSAREEGVPQPRRPYKVHQPHAREQQGRVLCERPKSHTMDADDKTCRSIDNCLSIN